MAGFLKKKLMEDLTKNGNNGELTVADVKKTFKGFRLKNKDLYPLFRELESEGVIKITGKFQFIRIKLLKKLRL